MPFFHPEFPWRDKKSMAEVAAGRHNAEVAWILYCAYGHDDAVEAH
jgi:hypothetical protein